MDEQGILSQINEFVAEEHRLREQHERGELNEADERDRLRRLEVALDQCWDLLRQRRAKREIGEDPDGAQVRPPSEVEGYLQ